MAKFGERLKYLRNLRGLSQMELAKQLKISKSSVNMYERCEREPGLETLEAIADYFNVDLDYLLGKTDFTNRHEWLHSVSNQGESKGKQVNLVRLAGRDGSYEERILTDQQLAALRAILDQMPDASEDL